MEEPVGNGNSIIVAGRPVPLGGGVRVVLWNEMMLYGPREQAMFVNANRPLPALNFYYPFNPLTAGTTATLAGKKDRPRVGREDLGEIFDREATIDGTTYWVSSVRWDAASRGAALKRLKKINKFVLHHDECFSSLNCYNVLWTKGLSVHLMLDYDGTVYQACDLAHSTEHVGPNLNPTCIGVEIDNHGKWKDPFTYGKVRVGPAADDKAFKAALTTAGATTRALPGGATAYSIPAERHHLWYDKKHPAPAPIAFDGFVSGKQAFWSCDKAAQKAWMTKRSAHAAWAAKHAKWKRAHEAWNKKVKKLRSAGVTTLPPEPVEPVEPALPPSPPVKQDETDHVMPNYTEAQHHALPYLVRAVANCSEFSIAPVVLGEHEHLGTRFTLAAETLEAFLEAQAKFSGVTCHTSLSTGNRWDPGPCVRWSEISDALTGTVAAAKSIAPELSLPASWAHSHVDAVSVPEGHTADSLKDGTKGLRPTDLSGDDPEKRRQGFDGTAEAKDAREAAFFYLAALYNLGYLANDCGPTDAQQTDAMRAALNEFQKKVGITTTGALNTDTRRALRDTWKREVAAFVDATGGRTPGAFET
jgi:hypothetical protein